MNYSTIVVKGNRFIVLGAIALVVGASSNLSTLNSQPSTSSIPSTLNSQPSPPLIAQASTEAEESATPREQPVTRKSALEPGAVRAIEQPGRQAEKRVEKPKNAVQKVKKSAKQEEPKAEPTTINREMESPAEGPTSPAAEKVQTPNPKTQKPSHLSAGASAKEEPSTLNLQPSAQESPVDDSIRTLTGPPSSLHAKPEPETTPAQETSVPSAAASTSSSEPKLNAVQAMDIADIEARTRGYDLGEYQLPKAEYDDATDTWSVSYIARDGAKNAKRLSVIVQDKSGQADVKK